MKKKFQLFQPKQVKWILIFPVLIIFLLSTTLSFSRIIRYRDWNAGLIWMHWIGFLIWLSGYVYLLFILLKKGSRSDFILFSSIQLLIGIGLVSIWRLNRLFGFRQSLWVIFCSLIAGLLIRNQHFLGVFKKYKYIFLVSGLGLIILTFFFGAYPGGNGPDLWLGLQGVYFQPSELLKLILIFYLAAYFSGKPVTSANQIRFIFPTAVLALAAIILLVFQRDFGTALIFLSIYLLTLFSVYGKRRILLFSFLLVTLITLVGYFFIDLIRIRFNAWIFPWIDPQAGSYQIIQSIIAIAAGGILGTGMGLGYPNLVPLAHSDFIFSAIVEELGLVGAIGILCLLVIILLKGIRISLTAGNRYYQYLAIGITSYLITQSILIIGGNIRLLPITGVTLPFVSYGGSSLLVSFLSFAILMIIEDEQSSLQMTNRKSHKTVALFFISCFIAIALTLGWWGVINSDDIQQRGDNARNIIANLFVKRGEIYDRNNLVLAESIGKPGEIERVYTIPQLSNTIGFSHQKFGLTGIEASFDPFLRGFRGYPSQEIWVSYLLYDQPPEGRPLRLTIDAALQQKSDQLMQKVTGGMVLLDANNGEILSISTNPHFDANTLDENFEEWQEDISSPLLNRVTQSAYPIGGLISPLLLTYPEDINPIEEADDYYPLSYDAFENRCILNENNTITALKNGCVTLALSLANETNPINLMENGTLSILFSKMDLGIETVESRVNLSGNNWVDLLAGNNILRSNPLQIASAFLPFSNQGMAISPSIVSAVNTSEGGWVFIYEPKREQVISKELAEKISFLLSGEESNTWEISAVSSDTNGKYQWFVSGTRNIPTDDKNYILVLVLENSSREQAISIGKTFLKNVSE